MFEDVLSSHSQVCEVTHNVFSYQTLSTSSTEPSGIIGKYEALKLGRILTSRTHTSSWELPFNTETIKRSNIHKQDVYHIKIQETTKIRGACTTTLQNYCLLMHKWCLLMCLYYSRNFPAMKQLNETEPCTSPMFSHICIKSFWT